MKFNIKSLLTGTTLVVASTTGIMADPPKELKLIPGETIDHPVFGKMKVISHGEDLAFYHQKVKDPNKPLFENEYDEGLLAQNFIKYVLNADSLKQANVPQEDIENFVKGCCQSQAGMAALKVITANYMREYDRIKQFCGKHEADLKACYDLSQTPAGEKFYERERKIFELEENLKELFDLKTDPFGHSKVKVEISREDLLKLSKYCQDHQNENLVTLRDSLPLSEKIIKSHKQRELKIRKYFFDDCKDKLKTLSDLCEEAKQKNKNSDSDKRLGEASENAYKKETEKANKEKFSCIRRSVMPACYFPILYRHFFVENDSKYSDIKTVNKFLYRALKLKNDDDGEIFVSQTLSIGLTKEPEESKNYHVDSFGKFSAFKGDRYDALLHELMHFMNHIDCFEASENAPNIGLHTSKNIQNIEVVVSKLEFSKEDIYKKEDEEDEEEDNGEPNRKFTKGELDDIRSKLAGTLKSLYDNACETWTMYGIFIYQDKQNPEKYEFYYDPINEAVANSECKIIDGEKEQVVRTGHCEFDDNSEQNRIDPDEDTSFLAVEVLAKKIDVYQFYFDKGERLRKLIHK